MATDAGRIVARERLNFRSVGYAPSLFHRYETYGARTMRRRTHRRKRSAWGTHPRSAMRLALIIGRAKIGPDIARATGPVAKRQDNVMEEGAA
jgi:hypothetical protein